jgi:hypothetical protein
MNWIDRTSFLRLLAIYVAVMIVSPVVGAFLFFFPNLPVCELMGWEFSNLGPIATFILGILFDIFVATPGFIVATLIKLVRRLTRP